MMRYQRRNTFRTGVIGVTVVVLVAATATSVQSLPFFGDGRSFTAEVADAAGLRVGDDVMQYGVTVGRVSSMELDGDHVDVMFDVDDQARLGSRTSMSISTATVLGTRVVTLTSDGTGELPAGSVIPRDRTSVPYDLTSALGDLTHAAQDIDTGQLADSLRAVNDVLDQTPAELEPAVAGLGALSRTVAERDEQLRALLTKADQVSGVLADRSEAVADLIGDVDVILGELVERRRTVETLFANVTTLSQSLQNVIADNKAALGPALDSANQALTVLGRNRQNIGKAIDSLAPYITELGEAVSSGPFFSSYITNLLPAQMIEPALRTAMNDAGIPYPIKGDK
ncbi:MCE family protein [Gordonia sp. HY002]|uniref:MCE family protein n=1 Tax=Gordonia zhenghanii TaxID=2911516 RepID=UPI001EF084D3|nr:MCE family protein [Gordonia zhenghanii]MCF8571249.1 MCE family protein [Gordonia zhenghanii]MCF8601773.1 MCE family protein [Gordonia zhenghanii]